MEKSGNNLEKKSLFETNKEEIKRLLEEKLEPRIANGFLDMAEALSVEDEAAQPCGVEVMELAHTKDIPVAMVTAHHAIGQFGVYPVNEILKKEGVVNGAFREEFEQCAGFDSGMDNCDIFWMVKPSLRMEDRINNEADEEKYRALVERVAKKEFTDPEFKIESHNGTGVWGFRLAYERICNKLQDPQSINLLFVEDVSLNQDFAQILFTEVAKGKGQELNLKIVGDLKSALKELEEGEYDGVVSDLYFPSETGSGSKEEGKAIFKRILTSLADGDESFADAILEKIS
jgi:hypothetical protein